MINPLDKLSHGMRARGHEERGAARTRRRRCRLAGRGARAHAADARVRPIRILGWHASDGVGGGERPQVMSGLAWPGPILVGFWGTP